MCVRVCAGAQERRSRKRGCVLTAPCGHHHAGGIHKPAERPSLSNGNSGLSYYARILKQLTSDGEAATDEPSLDTKAGYEFQPRLPLACGGGPAFGEKRRSGAKGPIKSGLASARQLTELGPKSRRTSMKGGTRDGGSCCVALLRALRSLCGRPRAPEEAMCDCMGLPLEGPPAEAPSMAGGAQATQGGEGVGGVEGARTGGVEMTNLSPRGSPVLAPVAGLGKEGGGREGGGSLGGDSRASSPGMGGSPYRSPLGGSPALSATPPPPGSSPSALSFA